jgi:hypothetical protein
VPNILPYFYQILLIEYSLLFFLVAVTARIRFFRLLYISTRETVLLTLVMTAIFIGIRYSQNKEAIAAASSGYSFIIKTAVTLGWYYIMFLLLFYITSISFNMMRQANTFWAVMTIGEKARLVLVPFIILILNLYLCGLLIADFY